MSIATPLPIEVTAIVFDLDGVLANSIAVVEQAWEIWCADHGLNFEEVKHVMHGRRKPEILAIVVPQLDPIPEIDRLMKLEGERISAVRQIPGAVELIALLPPAAWAIATSGELPGALARLKHVGIAPPAVLISSEDVERGKPDPQVYLKAAAGLGVAPERCLVFEDAPAGIAAALAAGMRAVAVLTTYPPSAFPAGVPQIPDLTRVSLFVSNGLSVTLLS